MNNPPTKIKGTFLRIEKEGSNFRIWYVSESGEVRSVGLSGVHVQQEADGAREKIEMWQEFLQGTNDEAKIVMLKGALEEFSIEALWPTMFTAYHQGKSLKKFFEPIQTGIEQPKPRKKLWTKNKSEFCQYVRNEYKAHQGLYSSERDATFKLFRQFRFRDKKWTVEKCYGLLKKLPS